MGPEAGALPERVRTYVLAIAADALGSMPAEQVPGPLRRVATFTASRRAKAAGPQLLAALDEETFREHLAIQARAQSPALADALEQGERTAETAALAYVLRPDGWLDVLNEVAADEAREQEQQASAATQGEVADLRTRVAEQEAEVAALRQQLADAQEHAKAEAVSARHRIGLARAAARDASANADAARADVEDRLELSEAAAAAAKAEVERLTARVEALEADLDRARRAGRADREEITLRARLLLDTLLEAGYGLRQELALPVVEGAPADRVAETVAALAEAGVRTPSGANSRAVDDPDRVRDLLGLPRFHLVVDGYNVTRQEWDNQPLESQRSRLLRGLAPVAARTGIEITVVFDGANAEARPLVNAPRGVRVLFSPRDVIADDVIRDLVAAEPPGRPIGVVTSDQAIVRDVVRPGVYAVAASALVRLLG